MGDRTDEATAEELGAGRGRLRDRVAVVVGAGSFGGGWSNGKACAVAYAREGAAVVCADRKAEAAEETADLIRAEGGRAVAVQADATREPDVRTVVDRALEAYGRLDVMHNNVGFGGVVGTPDVIEPRLWDREMAIDLTTAYLGIRCAVPVMREQGSGVITTTSSTYAVRFPRQANVAYAAAKAGVEAMSRACAVAYGGEGIRVNCIRIGFSETAHMAAIVDATTAGGEEREAAMARSRRKVPLGEHGDPADIAAAAVYLASAEARYVTGVVLDVDGGLVHSPL